MVRSMFNFFCLSFFLSLEKKSFFVYLNAPYFRMIINSSGDNQVTYGSAIVGIWLDPCMLDYLDSQDNDHGIFPTSRSSNIHALSQIWFPCRDKKSCKQSIARDNSNLCYTYFDRYVRERWIQVTEWPLNMKYEWNWLPEMSNINLSRDSDTESLKLEQASWGVRHYIPTRTRLEILKLALAMTCQ